MHRPSHLRMKPQPLETTRPIAEPTTTQEREKKEEEKKYTTQRLTYGTSVIHQHDQDFSYY